MRVACQSGQGGTEVSDIIALMAEAKQQTGGSQAVSKFIIMLMKMERMFEAALDECISMVKQFPDDTQCYDELWECWIIIPKGRKVELRLLERLRDVPKLHSENPMAWFYYARALWEEGKYQSAVAACRKVLKINNSDMNLPAQYVAARALEATGQVAAALDILTENEYSRNEPGFIDYALAFARRLTEKLERAEYFQEVYKYCQARWQWPKCLHVKSALLLLDHAEEWMLRGGSFSRTLFEEALLILDLVPDEHDESCTNCHGHWNKGNTRTHLQVYTAFFDNRLVECLETALSLKKVKIKKPNHCLWCILSGRAVLTSSPNPNFLSFCWDAHRQENSEGAVICDHCQRVMRNSTLERNYRCGNCGNFDLCEECYEDNKAEHEEQYLTAPSWIQYPSALYPRLKLTQETGKEVGEEGEGGEHTLMIVDDWRRSELIGELSITEITRLGDII